MKAPIVQSQADEKETTSKGKIDYAQGLQTDVPNKYRELTLDPRYKRDKQQYRDFNRPETF